MPTRTAIQRVQQRDAWRLWPLILVVALAGATGGCLAWTNHDRTGIIEVTETPPAPTSVAA